METLVAVVIAFQTNRLFILLERLFIARILSGAVKYIHTIYKPRLQLET